MADSVESVESVRSVKATDDEKKAWVLRHVAGYQKAIQEDRASVYIGDVCRRYHVRFNPVLEIVKYEMGDKRTEQSQLNKEELKAFDEYTRKRNKVRCVNESTVYAD